MQPLLADQGQAVIIAITQAMRDKTGNMPPLPGIFPDYEAPIVRNAPDGARELVMARWGMPGPPQFGGAPITNVRNTKSAHWRRWLKVEHRCVVPFTSFCEYQDTKAHPIEGEHTLFGCLTTEANKEVGAIHPKAMQVILRRPDEIAHWLGDPGALDLQRPLPDGTLKIVASGERKDGDG